MSLNGKSRFTVESPRGMVVYLFVRRPTMLPDKGYMGNVG